MNRRAHAILLSLVFAAFADAAMAQVVMQPTPNPTVTAENEPWYLSGEPITYAGSFYYPAGPRVHFNATEMVRSGFYMGIPLYTRPTIEPYSVVYVPVGPGLLQPYERPRTGPLAETAGSLPSSLPPMPDTTVPGSSVMQAAGPPSRTTVVIPVQVPQPIGTTGGISPVPEAERAAEPRAATIGRVMPRRPTHTRIGGRPQGSNAIFIEFEGTRWYMAGPAETIDTTKLKRIGAYSGIPVWAKQSTDDGVIYVPVTQGGGSLAVPYSRRR